MGEKDAQTTLFRYVSTDLTLEEAVLSIARRRLTFTVDDLHVLEPMIESLHRDRRVLGAVLASLRKQGLIAPVNYERSTRKECHNRPIMRWQVRCDYGKERC
jgi:hypothetical protein